jgi:hypothetical protein
MATSRAPAVIDALIEILTSAGIPVLDGPVPTGDYSTAVFVGFDAGGEDAEYRAATSTSSWANLGAKVRNEEIQVMCGIWSVDGAGDTKAARDLVYGTLAAVEDALRADPSMGQSPPFAAEVSAHDLYQFPTQSGIECRIPFTINVRTRI